MSLAAVLAIGTLIRVVVPSLFPRITDALASTVETSTPIDSFRSIQEAFYLLKNDLDVYDGGVVYHPPLLVSLLNLVNDAFPENYVFIVFNILYAIVDLGIACKLIRANQWYDEHQRKRSKIEGLPFSSTFIAAFYLFNPLMILTNWSHSTAVFSYFLIIELVVQVVVDHNPFRAMIALAVGAYLSLTPGFLVVPVIALAFTVSADRDYTRLAVQCSAIFIASMATLLLLSFILSGTPDFFYQCYGNILFFDKFSPNMGLWWYIFTEMFDFFTPLYKGIFNLYHVIFVVPITVRFFERESEPQIGDSFLAVVMAHTWLSFSKSYPIIGDLGFVLSMLPIFKNTVIPHTKFMLINALTLIICLLLAPIFYYCWIVLGNGNSNFFFSMSLIWGGVYIVIFLDFIWGRLVFDYIQTNEVKDRKALRLTQI
uniref:Uncharacterized protein n=1 Tax=Candidozyma auris TaxID=498019 RepID=A0A0L0P8H9_CANAR